MKIFSISDLHLSFSSDKPMDIFGDAWANYFEEITLDWQKKVADDDIVLIAGDISWAMSLENAIVDMLEVSKLKGKKVIIRGNHDYWWSSYAKVKAATKGLEIYPIQNNAIRFDGYVICGTRGWSIANEGANEDDKKIFNREIIRLEISLKEAVSKLQTGDKLIAMVHYPPFDVNFANTPFTDLMEKYGVNKVVYGHLHGANCRSALNISKNGIEYYLTSCDKLANKLIQLY
ncbi:MAG: metallophosphoesterase [Clostridia bacterium]